MTEILVAFRNFTNAPTSHSCLLGTCKCVLKFKICTQITLIEMNFKSQHYPCVKYLQRHIFRGQENFLILSFRRVLYVICFLLGNSPASEFQ